ncbi:hypothetical protein FKM82_028618 [Ascaphus truei]
MKTDGVDACGRIHVDREGLVGGGDEDIHATKGHIHSDSDVHVGELGLDPKEDTASEGQVLDVGLVEAVAL